MEAVDTAWKESTCRVASTRTGQRLLDTEKPGRRNVTRSEVKQGSSIRRQWWRRRWAKRW